MKRKTLVLPALAGVLALLASACGDSDGGDSDKDTISVGTTDQFAVSEDAPAPFDPTATYDVSTWSIMRNTFQTLVRPPRSGTEPELDAARKCEFTDQVGEQYRCTLREGLKFSNGNELTTEDVAFSVRRMLAIGGELGPANLLSNLDRVETPSDTEIVFHLKVPDATFPYKLATPAGAIVDSESYPEKGYKKGFDVVGSGPYEIESFESGASEAVLARNPNYGGTLDIKNEKIELRFYKSSEAMEKALTSGKIDVMNRTISPEQVDRLKQDQSDDVELVETPGQEIRYLVFNTDSDEVGKQAVRRAMAEVIDRKSLARDVYRRTTEPLYSMVPTGLPGHRNSFFNEYGDPKTDTARRTLQQAGIDTPVKLTLHYTTDHYGAVTAEEFKLLQKQLNATRLFDVDVKGVPWEKYRTDAKEGAYEVYGYGWFPDFPDPDSFIGPFFDKGNFLNMPYVNKEIRNNLLPKTRKETNRASTAEDLGRMQDIISDEVPLLPLWQGKQYIAAGDDITGVEWALNSSSSLQLWELERGVSG
ncbi:ABC transporter substrate-binding protein [Streptomyces sp. Z26]|uniref:ABC transporter substrate-binding protein n=1 Tax=Streptomyces sp. Z26 TaxID=2500177 RepID=UPI000EF1464C|nr:ABC transporter substrate-binding protein [Streptomyces sp. Z26]RLL65924.1 peptide-binding protein [Streptomyces sp. Z26]